MKIPLATVTALVTIMLAGCGSEPVAEKKEPEPPPTPITGRQAFQYTFGMARNWSPDVQPLHIRSINLPNPKSEDGKAGAWEIVYASESRARMRTYTYSSVESPGNLHKGVFAGAEDGWRPGGSEKPFPAAAIKFDTSDVLKTAIAKSKAEYLDKPGDKPEVSFLLTVTPRSPDPFWQVYWGPSVSSAQWSVFVDASNGQYAGR